MHPASKAIRQVLVPLVLLALGACASTPSAEDIRASTAYLPASSCDGRAQFRRVFCTLAGQKQSPGAATPADCEQALWRLQDEGAPGPDTRTAPLPASLRAFVIGGAFADCFGEDSLAYGRGISELRERGIDIRGLPVNSRSSAEANAADLAHGLRSSAISTNDTVILIGYSKGIVDILQYFQDYPEGAALVDAVISVAGPARGSEVADRGAWAYDHFLSQAFSGRCDPGDGGAVDSLLSETRQQQLAAHPPPAHIRYYSLMALSTYEDLPRGLRPTGLMLAAGEQRSDGLVTPVEGMLPGSTLLGYANANHWAVAVDMEEQLAFMTAHPDKARYPRERLLEAMLRYVSADLADAAGGEPGTCGMTD